MALFVAELILLFHQLQRNCPLQEQDLAFSKEPYTLELPVSCVVRSAVVVAAGSAAQIANVAPAKIRVCVAVLRVTVESVMASVVTMALEVLTGPGKEVQAAVGYVAEDGIPVRTAALGPNVLRLNLRFGVFLLETIETDVGL